MSGHRVFRGSLVVNSAAVFSFARPSSQDSRQLVPKSIPRVADRLEVNQFNEGRNSGKRGHGCNEFVRRTERRETRGDGRDRKPGKLRQLFGRNFKTQVAEQLDNSGM